MSNSPRFPVKQLKIISIKNNLNERSFQGGVYVLCSYNPEGVVIKVERGELKSNFINQEFSSRHDFLGSLFLT